jgi:hypothetical protein
MTIKASFLSEHNEICDYKEIQCNYCKLKMKRKDEVRHTKDICLKEVMSIVSKLSDNYNDLKDNSELIKKQLQKSESDKKNLEYQLANEISSKNKILNDFKLANSNKDELIKTNSQLSNSLEELKSNNNKLVSNIKEYKLSYDKLKKYSEDLERKLRNNSPNRSPLGTNQNCKINPFDLFFTIKK